MIISGQIRYLPIPKRESPPSIYFLSILMLPGSSDSLCMKHHTNLTNEDAATTFRRNNILTRLPNTYVLRFSTDRGSMGTFHLGMVMVMDAHREVDHLRHLSCSPR